MTRTHEHGGVVYLGPEDLRRLSSLDVNRNPARTAVTRENLKIDARRSIQSADLVIYQDLRVDPDTLVVLKSRHLLSGTYKRVS